MKEVPVNESIGFIGLGIMGLPMARNLAAGGYSVAVYNRTKSKAAAAQAFGVRSASTPREAASNVRFLITMVTDPAALRQVMEGPDGFLAADSSGVTWIQMSTIDPDSTVACSDSARKKGWKYLDCPVTGSKQQVESAQLILLAGGEPDVLESARPLLMKMGKTIVHAGGVGAGSALKLCMNLIVAQMTTGLAEAVALAERSGIAPGRIFEALKQSPALDCGYFRIKESAFLNRDFTPAFSLANMLKDVRFMTSQAAKRGLKLPVSDAVKALMEKAVKDGHGDQDLTSLFLSLT